MKRTTSKYVHRIAPFSFLQLQPLSEISDLYLQNIQSSNWQTLRFKPPPSQSTIGWRVEFRPMEVRNCLFTNIKVRSAAVE